MASCSQPELGPACLPQEVWWGWVPVSSAKGIEWAKCCVNVDDYHLPDASSSSCLQPSLQPGERIFFSFLNCFASDCSHIWHKLLFTACIQWRDNIYHVQCLVCTDVQIPVAALHAAEEMHGGGYKSDPCTHLWAPVVPQTAPTAQLGASRTGCANKLGAC